MNKGSKDVQPYWRPNFVNQSNLPDIKVVRTDFTINFIAIAAALVVVFLLLQQEYRILVLNQSVAKLEGRVESANSKNAGYLRVSESFRKSAQSVAEVEEFFDTPYLVHEFLYGLSEIRNENLIFNSVGMSEAAFKVGSKKLVKYSISISGDAKDLTSINEFKKTLETDELLQHAGFELEVNEALSGRDSKTGMFPYSLAISITPTGKKSDSKASKAGGGS